jgi:hypothetical protein
MLVLDTSDEMLEFDQEESDGMEFCLQSDWGVSSFEMKTNFWDFENLTKLKRKQSKRTQMGSKPVIKGCKVRGTSYAGKRKA